MTTAAKSTGTIVQSWVPVELADELKEHAQRERRSVSSVVRNAIEDAVVGAPRRRAPSGSTTSTAVRRDL
jgi:CopG-like RHH_1 or ribbon-helix-helix domain, RHH_5